MAKTKKPPSACPVLSLEAARARRDAHGAAGTGRRGPAPPPPVLGADDDADQRVYTLGDALMFLFHLRAQGGSVFLQRHLERSISLAMATRPWCEYAFVDDAVAEELMSMHVDAIASSNQRYAAEWPDDD